MHLLESLSAERRLRCRVLPVGTSDAEIVAAVLQEKPEIFGLSVSMITSLSAAEDLLKRCAMAAPATRLMVGGFIVHDLPPDAFPGVLVARRVDDFMAMLEALAPTQTV